MTQTPAPKVRGGAWAAFYEGREAAMLLLDDFNRANNGGPPGASWSHLPTLSTAAANNLFVTNQAVAGLAGGNADYWNAQQFGPNSEAWITVVAKPPR